MHHPQYIWTGSCEDRPGIVATISTTLLQSGGNIVDLQQYQEAATNRFFMRVVFEHASDVEPLRQRLAANAETLGMDWRLRPRDRRHRGVILASRQDHCLGDLLYRCRTGEMPMDVVAVISNHPRETYDNMMLGDVPFHHLPVTAATKPAQEAQIREIIQSTGADLTILARYMQILSDEMTAFLRGRCINIHHSFLPAFIGAQPYRQAFERGVKLIGATAHYVTADLDEGPIIEQDVEPVSHRDTLDDLVRRGRDIERRVLARAVLNHLDDRVLVNGNKTVVFPK